MKISTRRSGKYCLLLILLGCILTATGGRIAAAEPVLPAAVNYVNVALQDIFRDLAETGGFRVLFAHPLQKRATMVIAPGSPVKKISGEIAANHGLTLKWLDTKTAVIGDENSLAGIDTASANLHVLPLHSVSPVTMAEILETVLPSHKIRYDFKGNNIAVMATPLELENVRELVNRWDIEKPVITVGVEVVEVTMDFLKELGIKDPASPQMKIYPIPERLEATIAQNTGKNSLVSFETTSLNDYKGRLFIGDRVPGIPEGEADTAAGYQTGYLDLGTAIDYRFEVIPRQKGELLLEVQAKVEIAGPGLEPGQRELKAAVGLVPEQAVMLTGALKRSEYLQMKTAPYELPFLSSLFAAGANADVLPEETATVIFLTPYFQEKTGETAQRQGSRPAEPESMKPEVSLVPEVPAVPEVTTVPEVTVKPEVPETVEVPVVYQIPPKEPPKAKIINIPYIVKKSETLYGIAKKFGVSVQQLITANHLEDPGKIKAGATLIVPVPNEFVYTVKTDETLWRLAKRYGTTVAVLKDLNSLANDEIKVGQKLVLPVPAAKIVNPEF